jgi:hypothetical protein
LESRGEIVGDLKKARPDLIVCGDCWPHVEKFHLRHAPASIEVIRKGGKCSVTGEELCDSDFENMVWTKIPDVGTAE